MPLYEFHCRDCKEDFELLVRSTKWQGTPCPKCGSTKLQKQLSVFASSGVQAGPSASSAACGVKRRHGGGCGCCH